MTEQIPLNPDILRWARQMSGYSIDDVVLKMGRKSVTSETFHRWEDGSSSPTYSQLEKLAYDIYKRPLALFFFPEPPQEETPRQFFRTLPQSEIDVMDHNLLQIIRSSLVMKENLRELYDGANPSTRKIYQDFKIYADDFNAVNIAGKVREYLSVPIMKQPVFKNPDEGLKYWRNLLEEYGIFVFKSPFKDDDCSGFCIYDDDFPVIYINNSQSKNRQIFTLFHELGHLFFSTGGVDFRNDDFIESMKGRDKKIEVFCNQFAGEFLVPSEDIRRQLNNRHIDDAVIGNLTKKYCVSAEVVLRRCLDIGFISHAVYDKKIMELKKIFSGYEKKSGGGDYYKTIGVYLGEHYIEAALSKYYQGKISKFQLADYLGIKEANVQKFEYNFLGSR